jgi:hypothetical protein
MYLCLVDCGLMVILLLLLLLLLFRKSAGTHRTHIYFNVFVSVLIEFGKLYCVYFFTLRILKVIVLCTSWSEQYHFGENRFNY